MKPQEVSHVFHFTFEKTSDEIKARAAQKVTELRASIGARAGRIAALRKEYGIDDAAMVELLTAARRSASDRLVYTYKSSMTVNPTSGGMEEDRTIGAGVVNNLLTESDYLESEKVAIAKLDMVVRNLRPLVRQGHTEDAYVLGYEELKFLGF